MARDINVSRQGSALTVHVHRRASEVKVMGESDVPHAKVRLK
jgi:hypothetical protein